MSDRDHPKQTTTSAKTMIGVCTLEDVIERMLNTDINDENDQD